MREMDDRAFDALWKTGAMALCMLPVWIKCGFDPKVCAATGAVMVVIWAAFEAFEAVERRREERHERELMEEAVRRRVNPATFDFSKLKDASEVAKLSHEQLMELMDSPEGREYAEREREAFYARRAGENGGEG